MTGVILLTLRELTAKKVTLGLFLVATLVWVMLGFAMNLDIVDGSLAGMKIFGQDADVQTNNGGEGVSQLPILRDFVLGIEKVVAGASYWMGILLTLFATAPLIGSLLERGRVDLILSKPIGRMALLGSHVLGVLTVVFSLALYLMGAVWLIMSIKTGIWNFHFLTSIAMVMIMFTIMYSVVLLIGVTTRSTALSLIVTYGLIFCSLIFLGKDTIAPQINMPWRQVFLGFYHVLPNFAEVTESVVQLAGGETVRSWYALISSAVFGVVMYALAAFRFARRDF